MGRHEPLGVRGEGCRVVGPQTGVTPTARTHVYINTEKKPKQNTKTTDQDLYKLRSAPPRSWVGDEDPLLQDQNFGAVKFAQLEGVSDLSERGGDRPTPRLGSDTRTRPPRPRAPSHLKVTSARMTKFQKFILLVGTEAGTGGDGRQRFLGGTATPAVPNRPSHVLGVTGSLRGGP